MLQLVDEFGFTIGTVDKFTAHEDGGLLHRAVSVLVVAGDGKMLVQRRASSKYHFAGKLSNAACTHPLPLEHPIEAGRRALQSELGINLDLTEVAQFTYSAHDPVSGYTEREYDHILTGVWSGDIRPNPDEVEELIWVTGTELRDQLTNHEAEFTLWFRQIIEQLITQPKWQNGIPEELGLFIEHFREKTGYP